MEQERKKAVVKVILFLLIGMATSLLTNLAMFWATKVLWLSSLLSGAFVVAVLFLIIDNYANIEDTLNKANGETKEEVKIDGKLQS